MQPFPLLGLLFLCLPFAFLFLLLEPSSCDQLASKSDTLHLRALGNESLMADLGPDLPICAPRRCHGSLLLHATRRP